MPIYYEYPGIEDLPASIDMRAGDLVRIPACGIVDRGDEDIARCLGLFTPGLGLGTGQFLPSGRPSMVVISAENPGHTEIHLLVGPDVTCGRRRVIGVTVLSPSE